MKTAVRTISKTKFLGAVRQCDVATVTAALREQAALAKLLDDRSRTPLHICAGRPVATAADTRAALATAKVLIAAGVDIDAIQPISDDGEIFPATALWYALAWGRNRPLAAYLLQQGADPNHCMFALVFADDLACAKLVRKRGARIDDVFGGETPLIYATRHRRNTFVAWLLDQGASPNARDRRGLTALHHAVRRRLPDATLKRLLAAGADARATADDGISVADLATRAQRALLGLDGAPQATRHKRSKKRATARA